MTDYWDGLGIENPLPELVFQRDSSFPTAQDAGICGRRVVSVDHFVKAVQELGEHRCPCPNGGRFEYKEERRIGLWSEFKFQCNGCHELRRVATDPVAEPTPLTDKAALGINDATVWAFTSIGSGHSHLEEATAVMEIPVMGKGTFLRREEALGKQWKAVLLGQMTEAGKEEKRLAEAAGDFCEDGCTPKITVVVDGGWSHRSHGHRYCANSGVAIIIGKRTKKLLYLGVRNKLCNTCHFYARKNVEAKKHTCYKNWDQSSGAVEADVLVEGFQRSMEMHGVQYRTFIGDGDSSVYYQIQSKVSYGRFVRKHECANHVVKCYTSRLYAIAKESKGGRPMLSGPRIKRIKNGARKAVSHYAEMLREDPADERQLVRDLATDLRNGPKHVFGCHDGCKSYFCDRTKGEDLYGTHPTMLKTKIMTAANSIAEKADRLINDDTSNLAEALMSLVAKLCGGKQINRCQKGSYEHRCQAAGLSFQLGPQWHAKTSKAMICESPGAVYKKYANKKMAAKDRRLPRKRLFDSQHDGKIRAACTSSPHYGANCMKPDMPPDELAEKAERQLQELQVDKELCEQIEAQTRGQADHSNWFEQRRLSLTASNFHAVCIRRDCTPCDALVKALLHPKSFTNSATEHGKQHESVALQLYGAQMNRVVQPCGLFVDLEHGFLAASPDGVVDEDRIVEVKCPLTAKEDEPLEAARKFSEKKEKEGDPVLRRSHRYFYQVQGQLHVTRRSICDFVVYTTKGIHVQEVRRDDNFWATKMKPFLVRFYRDCLLPEIVDSCVARSMEVRRPDWNRIAVEAREKAKKKALPEVTSSQPSS
ncbi:uncharacterized protein LOC144094390 [Amblyomma americanum]